MQIVDTTGDKPPKDLAAETSTNDDADIDIDAAMRAMAADYEERFAKETANATATHKAVMLQALRRFKEVGLRYEKPPAAIIEVAAVDCGTGKQVWKCTAGAVFSNLSDDEFFRVLHAEMNRWLNSGEFLLHHRR